MSEVSESGRRFWHAECITPLSQWFDPVVKIADRSPEPSHETNRTTATVDLSCQSPMYGDNNMPTTGQSH
ncbi:MAG: hypothetical protein SGJ20_12510, partial [Planctomycetota bacterium]|nr:hypothetical protein [Planctomycetota bacterium]